MKKLDIVAIQEGTVIPDDVLKKFQLSFLDIGKNANLERVSSFCGVVRRGTSILVSFPKHYISLKCFNKLSNSNKLKHIRLILKSILNYELNPSKKSSHYILFLCFLYFQNKDHIFENNHKY